MQLSATPTAFRYGYDENVTLKGGVVYTTEGANFFNSTLLLSAKDVTLNKGQVLVLTDNIRLSDSINVDTYGPSTDYTTVSLLTDNIGNYVYATDPGSITGSALSLTSNLTSATVFNLSYAYTSAGSLSTIDLCYTVTQGISSYALHINVYGTSSFSISSAPNAFTFVPVISSESLALLHSSGRFVVNTGLGGILDIQSALTPTPPNQLTFTSDAIFKVLRLRSANAYGGVQKPGESDLIKYTPINNDLSIDVSSGEVPFNYLISSIYKTLSSTVDININTLKNYYSPSHTQTAVLDQQLRSYSRIYTGLNQNEGYDKIYLGYNSEATKTTFVKDVDTYFHYPYGTAILPLSTSTLVSYGAYANTTPWRSDRIFKKVASYKNYGNWGDSSSPAQRGTYFCSWLSASPDAAIHPVWMDRYYDPRHVNLLGLSYSSVSALSSILTNSINNYPNLIWDSPTSLTFEPGTLYYYHRIGEYDNAALVTSLSGLTYAITNWNFALTNNVTGLTAGSITNFTVSNSGTDSSVKAPYYVIGNTYGIVNTNEDNFKDNAGNTLSFFAYRSDWTNIIADQILGNYFNGGIGLFNNNPIITPYFTVASALSSIHTFNTALVELNHETINTLVSAANDPLSGHNFTVKGSYDNSYYVIDNFSSNKFLTTFDPDDLITYKVALSAFAPTIFNETILEATLHTESNNDHIIVKTRNNINSCCYRKFLTNGILVSEVSATGFNNFVVDLYGEPQYFNSKFISATTLSGSNACVDSLNNVYSLSGTYTSDVLLRNGVQILTLSNPEYINCDHEDNLWITMNYKHLVKLNNRGEMIWLKQINTDDNILIAGGHRVINFVAELTSTGIQYFGLLQDGSSQYVYKITMNGDIVSKTFVPGLIPNGDSTGFDYQRKYIKPVTSTPGVHVKIVTRDSSLTTPAPKYITLNASTSGFSPGWHHFAITYDNTNLAKFFVDGNCVAQNTTSLPTGYVLNRIYNYKNNPQIAIGTSNFKTATLNQYIELPTTYLFNGNIADIRLYNITLNNSDIKAISKSYETNQFNNLSWVMPTGVRAYVEEIERFFLHRMPGSKAQSYNIRIRNSGITDPSVRTIVENNLRNASINIAPAYTELRSIIWE
jgi:hypothetical protein